MKLLITLFILASISFGEYLNFSTNYESANTTMRSAIMFKAFNYNMVTLYQDKEISKVGIINKGVQHIFSYGYLNNISLNNGLIFNNFGINNAIGLRYKNLNSEYKVLLAQELKHLYINFNNLSILNTLLSQTNHELLISEVSLLVNNYAFNTYLGMGFINKYQNNSFLQEDRAFYFVKGIIPIVWDNNKFSLKFQHVKYLKKSVASKPNSLKCDGYINRILMDTFFNTVESISVVYIDNKYYIGPNYILTKLNIAYDNSTFFHEYEIGYNQKLARNKEAYLGFKRGSYKDNLNNTLENIVYFKFKYEGLFL